MNNQIIVSSATLNSWEKELAAIESSLEGLRKRRFELTDLIDLAKKLLPENEKTGGLR